jgi:O-antigen/teichoic acid export membrane protein
MIYMRIDQIMLREMVGPEAVGIYSAALRLSEVWYMIPMIIVGSLFPTIIESKKKSEALYLERIQQLLNLMVTIALVIASGVTFSANCLILLLFGPLYATSAQVLMVHIWAGLFVSMGVVGGKWYLIENLQRLSLFRTSAGAVINLILNFLLIPAYGPVGAAITTVISYGFAAYLLDLTSSRTRLIFIFKTRAIVLGPIQLLKGK